jgi:hypothetical protein
MSGIEIDQPDQHTPDNYISIQIDNITPTKNESDKIRL